MKPFSGLAYLSKTKRSLFIIDDHNINTNYYDLCVTHIGWFINDWMRVVTIDQLPYHITENSQQIINVGIHDCSELMINNNNYYYIRQFVPLEIIDIDKLPHWANNRYQIKAVNINPVCIKYVKKPPIELVIKMLKKGSYFTKYISEDLLTSANEYIEIIDQCGFDNDAGCKKIDLYS